MSIEERDYKQELIARESTKKGMRGKLNAKCIECIYDPLSNGSWRKQVQECTSFSCPIYPERPVTSEERARISADNVAQMTPDERQAHDKKIAAIKDRLASSRV